MLPRERLINYGIDALSVSDLLALIIGSGSKEESVFSIAERLLNYGDDLTDLLDLEYQDLLKIKGIKDAKAAKIIAAIELSRRIFNYRSTKVRFTDTKSIFNYLKSYYLGKDNEEFIVLYLDQTMHLKKLIPISYGNKHHVELDTKKVIKNAVKLDSNYIVLVHNHPSGDPRPSPNDLLLTHQFVKVAEGIGISVLDHIIVTNDDFYSFVANKKLKYYKRKKIGD